MQPRRSPGSAPFRRPTMTASQAGIARPVAMSLVMIYVVALIVAPSDLGPRFLGVVWSPARITLVLLVLTAFATGLVGLQTFRDQPRWILLSWFAFLLVAVATTIINPGGPAIARLASMWIEGLLLYIIIQGVVADIPAVRSIIKSMIIATLFVALTSFVLSWFGLRYDSLLATLTGGPVGPNVSGDRFGLVRQQGSFPAALFFATWLAACSVFALIWTARPEGWVRAAAWSAWFALCGATIVLTASRIATTGMFASAAVYLWLQGRRLLALLALALSIATGVGFAALSLGPPPSLTPTPAPTVGAGGSAEPGQAPPEYPSESEILAGSNELRLKALKATVAAVAERPILGWGLLTAKNVVTTTGGSINYVDSSYLVVVVEMGLAGLAALLSLLFAIAWQARLALRVREGLALVLALISIVVIAVVAAFLQITQGYALFTLLIALVVVVARSVGSDRSGPTDLINGAAGSLHPQVGASSDAA